MSVRHILIVISGIMITFGCSALVFSTWSAFQAVVPEQLGVPTRLTWALYITVLYLAEAFSAPFIGKLAGQDRHPHRAVRHPHCSSASASS